MSRKRDKKAPITCNYSLFSKKVKKKFGGFRKKHYLCTRNQERCTSQRGFYAEIAQLVEHNLAKVGVAGPSPVFRSTC